MGAIAWRAGARLRCVRGLAVASMVIEVVVAAPHSRFKPAGSFALCCHKRRRHCERIFQILAFYSEDGRDIYVGDILAQFASSTRSETLS